MGNGWRGLKPAPKLTLPAQCMDVFRLLSDKWATETERKSSGQGDNKTSPRAMQHLGSESLLKPGIVVQGGCSQAPERLQMSLKDISPSSHHPG